MTTNTPLTYCLLWSEDATITVSLSHLVAFSRSATWVLTFPSIETDPVGNPVKSNRVSASRNDWTSESNDHDPGVPIGIVTFVPFSSDVFSTLSMVTEPTPSSSRATVAVTASPSRTERTWKDDDTASPDLEPRPNAPACVKFSRLVERPYDEYRYLISSRDIPTPKSCTEKNGSWKVGPVISTARV